MSMFKKIKSLFVVEETPGQPGEAIPTEPTVSKAAEPKVTHTTEQPVHTDNLQIDKESFDRFIQVLSDALSAKNQQGYDYLEFKEAVNSLRNMEPDEAKRFLTAFTMAKTLGVEKKILLDSASQYLFILKTENDKFSAAVEKQKVDKIKSRNDELLKVEQELVAKEQKIREMLTEIESKKKIREQLKLEMKDAAQKVEQVHASFKNAYETIVKQIQDDVEKMNNYLN